MTSRELAKYGLRQCSYVGMGRRRFVLFQRVTQNGMMLEFRREFNTKGDRDIKARLLIADIEASKHARPVA